MLIIVELLFIVLLAMVLLLLYRDERMTSKKVLSQAVVKEYWDGKERRRHVRFQNSLEIHYIVEKKAHRRKNGRTVDLSEGGMKMVLDEKLSAGTMLDLQVPIPGWKKTVEVEGEVVWSADAPQNDPSGKRFFYAGIRFAAPKGSRNTELIDYIRSLGSSAVSEAP